MVLMKMLKPTTMQLFKVCGMELFLNFWGNAKK